MELRLAVCWLSIGSSAKTLLLLLLLLSLLLLQLVGHGFKWAVASWDDDDNGNYYCYIITIYNVTGTIIIIKAVIILLFHCRSDNNS